MGSIVVGTGVVETGTIVVVVVVVTITGGAGVRNRPLPAPAPLPAEYVMDTAITVINMIINNAPAPNNMMR